MRGRLAPRYRRRVLPPHLQMLLVARSLHEEEPRQDVYEELADAGRHDVGGGGAEVNVEHEHGHYDGARDEHHGEQQVLAYQGHGQGGRRVDLIPPAVQTLFIFDG